MAMISISIGNRARRFAPSLLFQRRFACMSTRRSVCPISQTLVLFLFASLLLLQLLSDKKSFTIGALSTDPNSKVSAATTMKSAQELQQQWAGGRDVWPNVPIGNNSFMSIQSKVKEESSSSTCVAEDSQNNRPEWPAIVKESTLFGFGAYNPRGKNLSHEINERQHVLLNKDIESSLTDNNYNAIYWEAASIWDDGCLEKGFILSFSKAEEEEGLKLSVDLARKYDQGAIYRFHMEDGNRLMRETIAVLDEGTEAKVEIEIDNDAVIDLSLFSL